MAKFKNPRLNALLKYENPNVIHRFCYEYGVSHRLASVFFDDFKRFIWLSNKFCSASKYPIRQESVGLASFECLDIWQPIDEIWHTFMLFSSEYTKFSIKYFGVYLHHKPAPMNRSRRRRSGEISETDLESYVDLVVDELGYDVAKRWFVTYPKNYTKIKLQRLKLKALKK